MAQFPHASSLYVTVAPPGARRTKYVSPEHAAPPLPLHVLAVSIWPAVRMTLQYAYMVPDPPPAPLSSTGSLALYEAQREDPGGSGGGGGDGGGETGGGGGGRGGGDGGAGVATAYESNMSPLYPQLPATSCPCSMHQL